MVNNWFYENFMILNPEKSHYMCLGKHLDDNDVLNFNNLIIKSSKEVLKFRHKDRQEPKF